MRNREEGSLGLLLMVWGYRILLLLLMAAGICRFSSLPIALKSAECVVALMSSLVLTVIMQDVYHACDVGRARVSELIMSQILANTVCHVVIYLGTALYAHDLFNPLPQIVVLFLQCLLGVFWSWLANYIYFKCRRPSNAVVIYKSEKLLTKLYETPYFQTKYNVCKLIENPEDNIQQLREAIRDCDVVFTIGIPATLTNGIAKLCLEMGVKGYFMPHLGHIIMAGATHKAGFSVPMLRVERAGGHSEYRALKRLFDAFASLIGIILASPIMLVTAVAIWVEDHGPMFYRQVRLTKNGKEFKIIKFRSMRVNAEQDGVARLAGENDSRITRVGHFIRACRIDELPQLFNILKGDMSIVGPRPERPEIAKQYEETLPEFSLRLQVKAGLTGTAQVYGRYNTEPYNKLQMDLMYINEMSFLKDLQLILATVKILFVKESTQGIGDGKKTAMGDSDDKRHDAA